MQLRILADDLTGALDSAAAFRGEVPVYFDAPPAASGAPAASDASSGAPAASDASARGLGVSAVATATRDIDPAALPSALAPSITWLRGADIAFKKVDSLLRGNTLAEVIHLAQAGGFERIVFAPAYPQQGRLTRDGRLILQPGNSAPSFESSPASRPVHASGASASGGSSPGPVQTPDPCGPTLALALAAAGITVEVPDVNSPDDLLRVAAAALDPAARRSLWCGSAGLALALAQVLDWAPRGLTRLAGAQDPTLLLVSASHHAVTRAQWGHLLSQARSAWVVQGADAAALQAALAAMRTPAAATRPALLDLSARTQLDAAEAAQLLAEQVQAIAQHAPRPGVLAVVGGDTLRALCRATGAHGLLAGPAARAGWGQARWLGGRWDGVPCHSRSGAFGNPQDLAELVAALL